MVDGLPVSDWKNNYKPKFAGKPIEMEQYETSRSLAIRPDRSGFVLGTEYTLRSFDADGRQRWEQPGPAIAWGVDFSSDGRVIVVAYGDGTIRWRRWSDGRELLAVFVNRQTKTWVAWTPSGYYMASPGGEDLIGWLVNRGWSQAPDFFPASKFKDTYARADVVQQVLTTLDEGEAVLLANRSGPARPALGPASTSIIENLPPVLSILSPTDNSHADGTSVTVEYLVRSPSGIQIDTVEALINGMPAPNMSDDAKVKQCLSETKGIGYTDGALQGCRGSLTVELGSGTTEISVYVRAHGKTSNVAKTRVIR